MRINDNIALAFGIAGVLIMWPGAFVIGPMLAPLFAGRTETGEVIYLRPGQGAEGIGIILWIGLFMAVLGIGTRVWLAMQKRPANKPLQDNDVPPHPER
jgi:hypothetical protein